MPWIVGIDEAGYGPNFGPFVMTAVGCRLPGALAKNDLWKVLREAARRHSDPADDRIVVADSKLVYSSDRGLAALEQTVHAIIHDTKLQTLSHFIDRICPACSDEIKSEIWYHGSTVVPLAADADSCLRAGAVFGDTSKHLQIEWSYIASVVVCPAAFNVTVDKWRSKGAVLGMSLVSLLRGLPRDEEQVFVFVDKHGGRNSYCATLQPAFDEGMVLARMESAENSVYEVMDHGREVRITVQPRADTNHFCVALASMVSKYLRELLMLEFNQFWQKQVPGLKATAGYPTDSKRFWGDIEAVVRRLGCAEDALWRRR